MCRILITLLCCVSALLCVCSAAERIKVLFTPTICRLRCTAGRCTNYCERGNISTIYSNEEHTQTSGFRVFVCPLLCKNGGVCIQKDRCLCPPNFTGKFCHIPVSSSSSTSDTEKPPSSADALANQGLMQSEYILPLQNPQMNHTNGSPMVTVRVNHPPEASVKVHQVMKVTSGSTGLSGSRGHGTYRDVLLSDRADAPPPRVLAQTIRGDSSYTEASGFKYCFREVHNGQCSSPMPGLRSQETCCKGDGVAWGINDCILCPSGSGSRGSVEGSCPKGFERVNGNQCVDVNECLQPGFCENGKCVNTRGSYSCACNPGFLLDASQGICISQKVISEVKDQCFRIVSQGSCSLPILKNITKQICCCSRVGKAWGSKCEACPYFGLSEFREICPAGPGYHYSPNTLKLQHRVADPHTTLISETNHTSSTVRGSETSVSQSTRRYETPNNQTHTGAQPTTVRQNVQIQHTTSSQGNLVTSDVLIIQNKPQPNQNRQSGSTAASTNQPIREQPSIIRTQTSRPSVNRQPVPPFRPVPVTQHTPPSRPQDKRVCEADPQVCGSGRCVDVPGGKHTCVCNTGFILNSQAGRCQDINECVLTPRLCVYGQCENTVGSFRCVCPAGYQINTQQSQCSDIDECRQIPNPCTNGRCENTLGSFRCVCRTGYKLQDNTCTDVDECEDPLRCPGTECVNSQGSYRCVSCKPGFGLLNEQCADIDECRQRPSPCTNGRCENTPGSYKCVCNTGFKPLGNACTDVNECEDPLRCPGLDCLNTPGSYRCVSCGPGFTFSSGRCSDIDECRQVPAPCSNGHCENTHGSYRCVCRTGYRQQGNTCTDVDECENSLQCRGQVCVNTPGSYRCTACGTGFSFRNGQCTDVDECAQNSRLCTNGRCENTPGSFRCVCRAGFRLEENTCTDVNECENELQCPEQKCVNSVGSFKCVSCDPGFQIKSGQCQDVDECSQTPPPCSNGQCKNTPGSYSCSCRPGFKQQGNTCTDVDECSQTPPPCSNGQCKNTPGSYSCSCRPGFKQLGNTCTDVDECSQTPPPCSSGQCRNTPGSYSCSCHPGFKQQGNTCTDVDECSQTPPPCSNGQCKNTPGSYSCSCRPGFKQLGNTCTDVDECSQTSSPCSSGQCKNTPGSYSCSCHPGFKQQGNTCTDVDECSQTPSPCSNGQCKNTPGSYSCSCRPGFKQQGNTCTDVDECSQTPPPCSNGQCKNTPGSYSCSCRPGFKQQGNTCTDVDECSQTLSPCSSGQCRNTPGSYSCSCRPGFKQQGNTCTDVDECSQTPPPCSNGQCKNTPGSYSCSCRPGFKQQGNTCTDVDECESSGLCGLKNACVNTEGSYRCECSPGYRATGPGRQCRDINECLEGEFCFTRGECLNTEGSYMCVCAQGYQTTGNGTVCTDIDECAKDGVCENGVCTNTEGSFMCHCRTGFTANPEKSICLDVDECVDSEGSVCEFQRCENTIGSYRCVVTCEPGYSLNPTGECVDINECANETVCGKHMCLNLIGTYQCICDQGYEVDYAGKCVDINECMTMAGVCGTARCWNVEGSFTCECENRQEEYNPITRQCVNPASSSGPSRPGEKKECYSTVVERDQCSVLSVNTSLQECCCTVGRAWGLKCKYTLCPQPETPDFNVMCPSGRGYVYSVYSGHMFPSTAGGFSYRDVDECKLFDPALCKGGVCVNTIPGYSCYCPNGYYYDQTLLQCIDNNECDGGEVCLGGGCVNTLGSYYCTCEPPLVLDDTQQYCLNSSALTVENRSYCWGHVTADLMCQSLLQGLQLTYVECCCSYGEAWGLQCALCPRRDEAAYEAMCTAIGPPPESPYYTEHFPSLPERGGAYSPPYSAPVYPDFSLPDYTDYSAGAVRRSGLRTLPSSSYTPFIPPAVGSSSYYGEEDYDSAPQPPFTPERSYTSRFNPASITTGDEEEEGPWRVSAPFPPYTDRRAGSERPRRVYDGRYDSYAGLAEGECGILQGCENGRCVRVGEGYTCDCYDGYQLEVTTMSCRDIDECEDLGYRECINARCVNTDGSYRCVCLRGFVMSRRSNYCIPA
ncbi:latent-transforming growth factor beta-binding protein 4 isoform X2 [Trichomycterus rosablanca]|uniref:latent-transforming growth factor beta-binding protein 4 isoform X2 n=1 Tax=Trichomycterus rosablanca TaxID=2290929 RepID=UPI002F35CB27